MRHKIGEIQQFPVQERTQEVHFPFPSPLALGAKSWWEEACCLWDPIPSFSNLSLHLGSVAASEGSLLMPEAGKESWLQGSCQDSHFIDRRELAPWLSKCWVWGLVAECQEQDLQDHPPLLLSARGPRQGWGMARPNLHRILTEQRRSGLVSEPINYAQEKQTNKNSAPTTFNSRTQKQKVRVVSCRHSAKALGQAPGTKFEIVSLSPWLGLNIKL